MRAVLDSMYALLEQFAQEEGEKRFLFTDTRCYTAQSTLWEVKCLAAQLMEAGIKTQDWIVLRATRSIDTALLFLALQAVGAAAILTDPHQTAEETLCESKTGILVTGFLTNEAAGGGLAAEGNWKLIKTSKKLEEKAIQFSQPQKDCKVSLPAIDTNAAAAVIFTSGSTGCAKAVQLSQYNMINHAINYGYGGCYEKSDVSAELLPMYHVFGLAVLLTALCHRYEVYFPKEVTPQSILESIQTYQLTRLDGVPSLLYAVARMAKQQAISTESLRIGVIGGAPVPQDKFSYIEKTLGLVLVPVYGMSECIGITGLPKEAPEEARRVTVGRFLPMNQGCIKKQSGEYAKENEIGEICVKSPAVMIGYYGQEESDEKSVDAQGWLHTGDLGYLDEEGLLHLAGRIKDIIIRNGNNISAAQIEQKLNQLSVVEEAVIVGIPDDEAGEVPAAWIVVKKESSFSLQMLQTVLTKLELPKAIKTADTILLTASGKPDRQRIKEFFLQDLCKSQD